MGRNIAKVRQAKSLTQKELAEKAGISLSYLKKIEKGHYKKPHIKTLSIIANALETDLRKLWEEE
ncbi:helix-turn-helix domain-containing protein [Syntrophobotulus glycolicus]|uniref:helix-turn-helix domain-containing protein n=1 Tax=Syntrophobotulus glycolicus TaxID=51197 RepID=UPI00059EB304